MPLQLKGTGVALVTPFNDDESVDYKALQKLVNYVIANGVDFLVSLGTTGETPTLTSDEKRKVVDTTIEVNAGRVPLIVGFGGNNTKKVIDEIKIFGLDNVDGILSASPSYNKPTQTGIIEHYKAIADNTDLEIILYNVPSRTASNMTAETTLALSEVSNITAVKEASGDLAQSMEILKHKADDFALLSGDDLLTLPLISAGASGVISVVANAFPGNFSRMVNFCLDHNFEQGQELHYKLMDTINLLFAEGNPAGIKCSLELMHICKAVLRLPLTAVSKKTKDALAREIEKLKTEEILVN